MSLKSSRGGRKIDQGTFWLRMIVSASNHLYHYILTSIQASGEKSLLYLHDPFRSLADGFCQFPYDD